MTYTDEEIIKALDTCADESEDCANCPFRTDIERCNRLTKIALELIKRQRAELEKRQYEACNLINFMHCMKPACISQKLESI